MRKRKKLHKKKRKTVRYIKRYAEHVRKEDFNLIPKAVRGIYALLQKKRRKGRDYFDVVYVGMSRDNIKRRIKAHTRSKRKKDLWTHFSLFEVYDNIFDDEIEELEGLFRVIYRKDRKANILNVHKRFKKFKGLKKGIKKWKKE